METINTNLVIGDWHITLDFRELRAGDCLLIHTFNSAYKFLITDAVSLRGHLWDGSRQSDLPESILAGGLARGGPGAQAECRALQSEAQALFLVQDEEGIKRIVTSPITRLVRIP